MAVLFKKIRYKNFMSTGNGFMEVDLNSYDSTIIVGKNGAGKSTLIVALFFVLFNRVYRNVKRNNLVNSINRKNCVVELELEVPSGEYKIVRGLKPNIFEIYRNGELIDQSSSVKDYQEILEKSIGLNYKSFQQVVVLSSASYTPFMQLSAPDRREIVEDLLDIGIFSSMNEITKTKVSDLQTELNNIDFKLSSNHSTINKLKVAIDNSKTDYDSLISGLNNDIETLLNEYNKQKNEYQSLTEKSVSEENIEKIKTKIRNFKNKQDEIQGKITGCEYSIKDSDKSIKLYNSGMCPTCGVEFYLLGDKLKNKLKEYEYKKEEYNSTKKTLLKYKDEYQAKLDKYNEVLDKALQYNSDLVLAKRKLNEIKNNVKSKQNTINDIESRRNKVIDDTVLNNLIEENKVLEKRKYTINDELRYYKSLLKMVKDDGIKSKIISQYLPFMNERINYYLEQMDAFFDFTLDENFNETIKSRFRDEFSYYSFSEGEKQRIDISLLLTWRDLAKKKNSVDTNLLILDEIFDSSLDSSAIDMLSNILISLLSKENNIFVISHNTEQMIDKFDRIINVKKINNFTEMDVV